MKDFLGNEYAVGDTVVYAGMSGRSVTMMLAKVVEFKDNGSVQLAPLQGSRWATASSEPRTSGYIDKRTGKGIEPHCKSHKHHEVPPGWVHKVTGERISSAEFEQRFPYRPNFGRYGGPKVDPDRINWTYDYQGVLKDYVVKGVPEDAKPNTVNIIVTKNIVKVQVPDE